LRGQVEAIGKAQAVIEFEMDGTIRYANEIFLACGYTLDEIKGKHQRVLVDPAYRDSAEYRAFWAKLAGGEYEVGEYRRIGQGGREIWLQASYNPILDARTEKPSRSFSTPDITEHKARQADYRRAGGCDRQGAGRDRVRDGRHHPQRQ
jgi:methyl-accepting chemotaxis protein